MSEILNNYKKRHIETYLLTDKYFDVVLAHEDSGFYNTKYDGSLTEKCLSSYIDLQDKNCISGDSLCSLKTWENAVSENAALKDAGFTFTDNGRIWFDKYAAGNGEAIDKIVNSKFNITDGDLKLTLKEVSGITQECKYPVKVMNDGYTKLTGGFYQGVFKYFGFNHEILPTVIENEWNMEFVLRPQKYKTPKNILNDFYPENGGIFFYIGTRAENKFAQFYGNSFEGYEKDEINSGFCENFEEKTYAETLPVEKENKKKDGMDVLYPFNQQFSFNDPCSCDCIERQNKNDEEKEQQNTNPCDFYFGDDYLKTGDTLNAPLETSDGKPLYTNGYFEIKTDNKHLFFNRTKNGFTTENWVDADVVLTGITKNYNTNLQNNLFLIMNRTKNGFTTGNIDKLDGLTETEKYDFKKDIKNNAFALKYNPDGSISYRYLIYDCDSEAGFSVVEETSFSDIISPEEWNVVTVKFKVLNGFVNECNISSTGRKMKLYIYVNGYLKMVSKELPVFDFHELDDTFDKQEGVPFNISLGGGTQGLRESINFKYWEKFPYLLPLEKHFAGTFIGDIRSFKFYTCAMDYAHIKNNSIFELKK